MIGKTLDDLEAALKVINFEISEINEEYLAPVFTVNRPLEEKQAKKTGALVIRIIPRKEERMVL